MNPSVQRARRAGLLWVSMLVTAAAWAQPAPTKCSLKLELTVRKLVNVGEDARPFPSVGVFEVVNGDAAVAKACPSNSSGRGVLVCRLSGDASDDTPITLLVRAPGAERVPGYESPVSVEVAQQGCKLEPAKIAFTYKALEYALAETLASDVALAQAVTGGSTVSAASGAFAALQNFDRAAPALQQMASRGNPSVARFTRIMRDAELSALKVPAQAAPAPWARRAAEYSTGTRSILLNDAAIRSLGQDAGSRLVPITRDPVQLQSAKIELAAALQQKPGKSAYDAALATELVRTTPAMVGKPKPGKDIKAMDWAALERAQFKGAVRP